MCPLTGCKLELTDMLEQRNIEQLFRRNYSEMIHLARVMLGDDGEADDVVQDIFLRIASSDSWRGTNGRRPSGKPIEIPDTEAADFKSASARKSGNYLLVAVRNACLNRIRQKQLHEKVKNLLPIDADADFQPIDKEQERLEDIATFVDSQMEEPHRSIFHLRFDEDLTIADIARRLGLNPSTTYKYLAQCMEHIRRHLNIH